MEVHRALCHLRAETDRSRVRMGDTQIDSPKKVITDRKKLRITFEYV